MPKRATALELPLPPRPAGTPAHRWLYDSLRGAILDGRLRPGSKLPSTRELAARHRLARGTVVRAFEQLAAEGYLEGTVGAGTFVGRNLPDALLAVTAVTPPPEPAILDPGARDEDSSTRATRATSGLAHRARLFEGFAPKPTRAFRPNLPAIDLFPTALWAQLAGRRLRAATQRDLMGCPPLGVAPLREVIADYLRHSRGVRCRADQVLILSGVQEALDLVARLLVEPGDRVVVEEPGYPGATRLFATAGAEVLGWPVDEEGIVVPQSGATGPRRATQTSSRAHGRTGVAEAVPPSAPRLIYVTPAHQYPLGVTMSLPRRLALLAWARQAGAWIFEDDYDSEYRYSGRPVPALQGLDASGTVLFAGSFSKVLFPSLRLGYLVLPDRLIDAAEAVRSLQVRHPPLLEQRVLCDFLAGGHFGRHLRRMRTIYAERLATLLDAARERLGDRLLLSPVEAGLQTAARLAPGLDPGVIARVAAEQNVEVVPLGEFFAGTPTVSGLQLGFAAVDTAELRRGVEVLAEITAAGGR